MHLKKKKLTLKHIPQNGQTTQILSKVVQKDEKGEIIKQYDVQIQIY